MRKKNINCYESMPQCIKNANSTPIYTFQSYKRVSHSANQTISRIKISKLQSCFSKPVALITKYVKRYFSCPLEAYVQFPKNFVKEQSGPSYLSAACRNFKKKLVFQYSKKKFVAKPVFTFQKVNSSKNNELDNKVSLFDDTCSTNIRIPETSDVDCTDLCLNTQTESNFSFNVNGNATEATSQPISLQKSKKRQRIVRGFRYKKTKPRKRTSKILDHSKMDNLDPLEGFQKNNAGKVFTKDRFSENIFESQQSAAECYEYETESANHVDGCYDNNIYCYEDGKRGNIDYSPLDMSSAEVNKNHFESRQNAPLEFEANNADAKNTGEYSQDNLLLDIPTNGVFENDFYGEHSDPIKKKANHVSTTTRKKTNVSYLSLDIPIDKALQNNPKHEKTRLCESQTYNVDNPPEEPYAQIKSVSKNFFNSEDSPRYHSGEFRKNLPLNTSTKPTNLKTSAEHLNRLQEKAYNCSQKVQINSKPFERSQNQHMRLFSTENSPITNSSKKDLFLNNNDESPNRDIKTTVTYDNNIRNTSSKRELRKVEKPSTKLDKDSCFNYTITNKLAKHAVIGKFEQGLEDSDNLSMNRSASSQRKSFDCKNHLNEKRKNLYGVDSSIPQANKSYVSSRYIDSNECDKHFENSNSCAISKQKSPTTQIYDKYDLKLNGHSPYAHYNSRNRDSIYKYDQDNQYISPSNSLDSLIDVPESFPITRYSKCAKNRRLGDRYNQSSQYITPPTSLTAPNNHSEDFFITTRKKIDSTKSLDFANHGSQSSYRINPLVVQNISKEDLEYLNMDLESVKESKARDFSKVATKLENAVGDVVLSDRLHLQDFHPKYVGCPTYPKKASINYYSPKNDFRNSKKVDDFKSSSIGKKSEEISLAGCKHLFHSRVDTRHYLGPLCTNEIHDSAREDKEAYSADKTLKCRLSASRFNSLNDPQNQKSGKNLAQKSESTRIGLSTDLNSLKSFENSKFAKICPQKFKDLESDFSSKDFYSKNVKLQKPKNTSYADLFKNPKLKSLIRKISKRYAKKTFKSKHRNLIRENKGYKKMLKKYSSIADLYSKNQKIDCISDVNSCVFDAKTSKECFETTLEPTSLKNLQYIDSKRCKGCLGMIQKPTSLDHEKMCLQLSEEFVKSELETTNTGNQEIKGEKSKRWLESTNIPILPDTTEIDIQTTKKSLESTTILLDTNHKKIDISEDERCPNSKFKPVKANLNKQSSQTNTESLGPTSNPLDPNLMENNIRLNKEVEGLTNIPINSNPGETNFHDLQGTQNKLFEINDELAFIQKIEEDSKPTSVLLDKTEYELTEAISLEKGEASSRKNLLPQEKFNPDIYVQKALKYIAKIHESQDIIDVEPYLSTIFDFVNLNLQSLQSKNPPFQKKRPSTHDTNALYNFIETLTNVPHQSHNILIKLFLLKMTTSTKHEFSDLRIDDLPKIFNFFESHTKISSNAVISTHFDDQPSNKDPITGLSPIKNLSYSISDKRNSNPLDTIIHRDETFDYQNIPNGTVDSSTGQEYSSSNNFPVRKTKNLAQFSNTPSDFHSIFHDGKLADLLKEDPIHKNTDNFLNSDIDLNETSDFNNSIVNLNLKKRKRKEKDRRTQNTVEPKKVILSKESLETVEPNTNHMSDSFEFSKKYQEQNVDLKKIFDSKDSCDFIPNTSVDIKSHSTDDFFLNQGAGHPHTPDTPTTEFTNYDQNHSKLAYEENTPVESNSHLTENSPLPTPLNLVGNTYIQEIESTIVPCEGIGISSLTNKEDPKQQDSQTMCNNGIKESNNTSDHQVLSDIASDAFGNPKNKGNNLLTDIPNDSQCTSRICDELKASTHTSDNIEQNVSNTQKKKKFKQIYENVEKFQKHYVIERVKEKNKKQKFNPISGDPTCDKINTQFISILPAQKKSKRVQPSFTTFSTNNK